MIKNITDQVTELLENYNIPVDLVTQIKEKLEDGFQINDIVSLIQENKDRPEIQNSEELISNLQSIAGGTETLQNLKEGGLKAAGDKLKGIMGI